MGFCVDDDDDDVSVLLKRIRERHLPLRRCRRLTLISWCRSSSGNTTGDTLLQLAPTTGYRVCLHAAGWPQRCGIAAHSTYTLKHGVYFWTPARHVITAVHNARSRQSMRWMWGERGEVTIEMIKSVMLSIHLLLIVILFKSPGDGSICLFILRKCNAKATRLFCFDNG